MIKRRGALAIAGVCILAGAPMARAAAPPATAVAQVTAVVNRFERALQERNPAAVEALVSEDLVVFENGHRNDGWNVLEKRSEAWTIVMLDWSIAKVK